MDREQIKEILTKLPEGYVIWKYDGIVYGGEAKYMSDIYVDDYPTNVKKGKELEDYLQIKEKGL